MEMCRFSRIIRKKASYFIFFVITIVACDDLKCVHTRFATLVKRRDQIPLLPGADWASDWPVGSRTGWR